MARFRRSRRRSRYGRRGATGRFRMRRRRGSSRRRGYTVSRGGIRL